MYLDVGTGRSVNLHQEPKIILFLCYIVTLYGIIYLVRFCAE